MLQDGRFYDPDLLDELRSEGKIDNREYFLHHEEMKPQYEEFCRLHHLPVGISSAEDFFKYLLKKEKSDFEEAE